MYLDGRADYYEGSVVSASDYYPFGYGIPNRTIQSNSYRYGFNGKEKDENGEWGNQTHYNFGMRMYNPSLVRWLSVDPMARNFPFQSPYVAFDNNPIIYTDPNGGEAALCCNWFKAAVNGISEYAEQVFDNYVAGKKGFDAFTQVDISDIAVEFIDGALSPVGINETLKEIIKTTVDIRPFDDPASVKFELSFNKVKEGLVNSGVNKMFEKVTKGAKALSKKIDRAAERARIESDNLTRRSYKKPKKYNSDASKSRAKSKELDRLKNSKDSVKDIVDIAKKRTHTGIGKVDAVTQGIAGGVQGSIINQNVKNPINESEESKITPNLSVSFGYDDGGFLMINGKEVFRINAPNTNVDGDLTDKEGFEAVMNREPTDSDKVHKDHN